MPLLFCIQSRPDMKVLLDENIDVRFRFAFDGSGHEVFTTEYMGWKGVKNGALLRLMAEQGFDVLIAVAKSLPYQQNQQNVPTKVVILDVRRNVLPSLQRFVPELLRLFSEPLRRDVITLSEPIA